MGLGLVSGGFRVGLGWFRVSLGLVWGWLRVGCAVWGNFRVVLEWL